jgi:hypothetical protein
MIGKNMRFNIAIFLILVITIDLFSPLIAETITIPTGATLQLSLMETISSDKATVGQNVKFIVMNNLIIKKEVVIAGSSIAIGQIVTVEENGMFGKPGTIGIMLKSVNAVDGTNVPISASRVIKGDDKTTEALVVTLILCIFGLFIRGGDAEMQAGNLIEATVVGNIDINFGPTMDDNLGITENPSEKVNIKSQLSEKVILYMDIEKVSEQFLLIKNIVGADVKIGDKLNIVRYQFNKGGYVTIGIGEVIRIDNEKVILKHDLFDDDDKVLLNDQVQYE